MATAKAQASPKLQFLKNKIEMRYSPRSYAFAIKTMLAGWALLLGFSLLPSSGISQRIAMVDSWTAYPSYNAPKQIVKVGDLLYVICKGGLYTYDLKTKATKSYSTV